MFVQRKGTTVDRFPNVQQDGTRIRAVSRLGLGCVSRVVYESDLISGTGVS